ncbi:glutamate ABC transporter substrate-binding protein [Agrococcus casei]|uniref:Putative glutamate binding protein n=1 Tax=Agrococcus casei LMG 22410 TaxID=1255656 RepID=A0A1R4GJB9_9MICO|nr:glutamate ABC transporter substrate-binding protein [Agrococcus casei]SJM68220.1 putative glutamate binding protein [Agrococcus casei LMG 22410]
MMKRRFAAMAAAGAAAALVLTGCAGGGGGDNGDQPWTVAEDVTIEGSATFEAMQSAGQIVIGVKEDQPGLGYLDAATGERTGFDVDIARWMAAELGFGEDQIEFKAIPSANREQELVNGNIDMYVGTYSITDSRKEQIDFAGPYAITGQGLLVAADNDSINGPDDLAGTNVCSATGSTPIQNIRENYPEAKIQEFDTYSQCVAKIEDGSADAVTTDALILLGYAAQSPDTLKTVGDTFSEEIYGIGVPKGDDAFRDFLNTALEEGGETWTAIWDANLGETGVEGEQPAVDRY